MFFLLLLLYVLLLYVLLLLLLLLLPLQSGLFRVECTTPTFRHVEKHLGAPVRISATTPIGRQLEATARASLAADRGKKSASSLRAKCNEVWLEPGMAVCFPHDFRHEIVMPKQVRCSSFLVLCCYLFVLCLFFAGR